MSHKASTLEEYHRRINRITEYINNHLSEEIDLEKLAEVSGFSPYHFHRIARAFLGEPVGACIVRMRIEAAARLLRHTDLPIQEIADRVGYDVPSSLSKAFRQFYGIAPNEYRTDKNFTIMQPFRPTPTIALKRPKILTAEPRQVIYLRLTGEYSSLDFPGSYQKLWAYVKEHKLFTAGIEHLAVYFDDPNVTSPDRLRTDICLTIHKPVQPCGEIGVREIPGGRYAVFSYQGPYSQLGVVYDTICSQWLPESGEQLSDRPCFEMYRNNAAVTPPEKLKTDIYLPIE